MSFFFKCCLCLCTALSFNLLGGDLKVSETGGKFHIVHPSMRITIDTLHGGRISALTLSDNIALLGKKNTGLCLDHMKQSGWPGELINSAYTVKSKSLSDKQFKITLSKRILGKKAKTELSQLIIEKTFIIDSDSYCIQVKYRVINTTGELRQPSLWIQNVFSNKYKMYKYFRPSESGIALATFINNIATGKEYIPPVAGWTATLLPEVKSGLLMLTDYNYTERFYNCLSANSMEVFFDKIVIPSGKAWETVIKLRPLADFQTVDAADDSFVSGMTNKGGQARFEIAATTTRKRRLKVKVELNELGNDKFAVKTSKYFKSLSYKPGIVNVKLSKEISRGLLSRITISKRNIVLSNYNIFVPAFGSKAMEGFGSGYSVEKKQKIQKIFATGGQKVSNEKLEVLFVNGLFHEEWGVNKLTSLLKPAKISNVYHAIPPNSPSMIGKLTKNPLSNLKELVKFDVVVISNIPADAIGYNGNMFLKNFVSQGGLLVVLGGRFAYGAGGYKATPLEEILPCRIKRSFDLKKLSEPQQVKTKGNKSLGYAAWIHDLKIMKDAKVLAYVGNQPFLVKAHCGKGTVIACTGTVAGTLPGAKKFFWQTDEWSKLLSEHIMQNCNK